MWSDFPDNEMKTPMAKAFIYLLLTLMPVAAWADEAPVQVEKGQIGDALHAIAYPGSWNGNLLIFAHGLRPKEEPLRADLNPERPLYRTLLDQGWMIATSSYRRNGIIIKDAIEDLELLRELIVEQHGKPERILIMGNSMGGLIGTLIAESEGSGYDAILAAGAAVDTERLGGAVSFTYEPRIPILFLTNRSELKGPEEYVQNAAEAEVTPASWWVDRDGHVNVNDDERLAAIRALEQALDGGELARRKDGTIENSTDSTAQFAGSSAQGTIVGVTENHGNIFTSFVPEDLARLGIEQGDHFNLTVRDTTVTIFLGSNYRDVEQGEWIGIMRAEGVLMVARNRVSACQTLGCAPGDVIRISPSP